jgi:hypothetical protein
VTEQRQFRQMPDLLKQIEELYRRVTAVENAKRLGNSSLDGGELSIKGGDIVVRSEDDTPVTRIEHGDEPRIRFYPNEGVANLESQILAWENPGNGGSAIQMNVQQPGNVQDGGKVLLMNTVVYLSLQRAGLNECYFSIGESSLYPEHFRFRGRWRVGDQSNSDDAIVFGILNVGAGFGAASITFQQTFDTAPFVTYSILSAVGPVSHNLTAVSTTGFTVGWSGTTAKTIYWQAWRQ